ncbi:MAG: hypothetical protein HY820_36930 [Acidobacteria bacterium]|nr:hypothetical protein [Acidobacteriota bacterium]
MRSPAFLALAAAAAIASAQQSTTYGTDLNGRKTAYTSTAASQADGVFKRSELSQSVNGRTVPLESTEERVLRDDAGGRVVERIIRKFDPNGNPGGVEKQQVEERKNPDGSVSSTVSVYRGDLNGRLALSERIRTDAEKSGDTTTSAVSVERAGLNGGFELVERRNVTETLTKASSNVVVTTTRKNNSGQFVDALRVVTDSQEVNGQRVENQAQYEASDTGRLQLAAQTVTRLRKNADGSESKEVDIFRAVPGRADPTSKPALQERQLIEVRRQGENVTETTMVQRPTVSDPNRLGPAVRLTERVCAGKGCN